MQRTKPKSLPGQLESALLWLSYHRQLLLVVLHAMAAAAVADMWGKCSIVLSCPQAHCRGLRIWVIASLEEGIGKACMSSKHLCLSVIWPCFTA